MEDSAERGFGQVYDGASRTGTWFSQWPAHLRSADRDWIPERGRVVARSRDIFRNDPVAASAVARRKNSSVGKGWRFSSRPNARALGITLAQARELGQQIDTELKGHLYGYSFECDAERKRNFGQQLRLAAGHLGGADGEFTAIIEYAADEPTRYKTRLRMVDPDRLSNPSFRMDDDFLRGGIQTNASGAPVVYWFRERHPSDLGLSTKSFTWKPFTRFSTPLGRPQVLHGFDADRAGQTRGVTRFAATLKLFRGFHRFTDATIQNATLNALMFGFVSSSAGPEAVSENFTAEDLLRHEADREEFYKDNPVHIGDVQAPVFPLGDEFKIATATRDVTSFDSFTRAIIRLIAASLGVTYEELSMDYSQTNYSSARAALVHAWAETQAFNAILEAQLAKPYMVAWLEEAIDEGYVTLPEGAPDFYDAIDAYAEGKWIGPGRGYIDPTKEILAAAARIEAGISTLEDECAEQGKDWEEVLEQTAREQARRAELGLIPEANAVDQAGQDAKNPFREAGDPAPPEGTEAAVAPEDARPGARSALSRIASFAESADHMASLDARPSAIQL